jgi:mevalonate kinase
MSTRRASATGKIILSGEYALAFGYPGIAFPSQQSIVVRYTPRKHAKGLTVIWGKENFDPAWAMYAGQIAEYIAHAAGQRLSGELFIETDLPLGKGMGASTALVIAIARTLLGRDCRSAALQAEDTFNIGHSGMDFTVIWEGTPIVFQQGTSPRPFSLAADFWDRVEFIDTGMPDEHTPALVAWVSSRRQEIEQSLSDIGACTERILTGEALQTVLRDHHKAQVALGVVPPHTQTIIADIESRGGAAKVIGAGGRTGGGGMVLVLR